MAFVTSCETDSTSPYCICTDYYGNILPEYKYFDTSNQTYSCCNRLNNYNFSNTTDVYGFVSTAQNNTGCDRFLQSQNVTNTNELKQKLPLLYYQGLLLMSLQSNFTEADISSPPNIKCPTNTDIPYMLTYPSYMDNITNYKMVCANRNLDNVKDLKFYDTNIVLPYQLNYLLDASGKNCLVNECETGFNFNTENEYNIGDVAYKSSGDINSDSILLRWWFWFVMLMVIFIVGFGIYYIYYRGMNNYFNKSVEYLNKTKKGLGDTAKRHSNKVKDSHFHINT